MGPHKNLFLAVVHEVFWVMGYLLCYCYYYLLFYFLALGNFSDQCLKGPCIRIGMQHSAIKSLEIFGLGFEVNKLSVILS